MLSGLLWIFGDNFSFGWIIQYTYSVTQIVAPREKEGLAVDLSFGEKSSVAWTRLL
jgi:hypothetical protein